jgi:hypothetical protein
MGKNFIKGNRFFQKYGGMLIIIKIRIPPNK